MQIGIDSFAAIYPDPRTGIAPTPAQRLADLIAEIELADQVGLDAFGVGEHHRPEFVDEAPTMILAAAASRTKSIRLNSAVTVLSADDPVRVFQNFATLDLLSNGRAEIVAGRGSFVEAYPLFGYELKDYDDLFAEKLDLLLQIRDTNPITWQGNFRPALTRQTIYPRPVQTRLPIWLGVGGTPASFARAGTLGLPLMIAIIGGEPHRFRPLVDLYRDGPAAAPVMTPTPSRSASTCSASSPKPTSSPPTPSFPATPMPLPRSAGSAAGHPFAAPTTTPSSAALAPS